MIAIRVSLVTLIFGCCLEAAGQKQIVLLKRQDVLLRLYPGDDFVYKLYNTKSIRRSYVNKILPNAVITHHDTIYFDQIDRLYFQRSTFANRMGERFIILGAGLFLVDFINVSLVQGIDYKLDDRVSTISLAAVAAGLPMALIKKKSQKLGYKHRLRVVDRASPFYKPDPKGFMSPFIDN